MSTKQDDTIFSSNDPTQRSTTKSFTIRNHLEIKNFIKICWALRIETKMAIIGRGQRYKLKDSLLGGRAIDPSLSVRLWRIQKVNKKEEKDENIPFSCQLQTFNKSKRQGVTRAPATPSYRVGLQANTTGLAMVDTKFQKQSWITNQILPLQRKVGASLDMIYISHCIYMYMYHNRLTYMLGCGGITPCLPTIYCPGSNTLSTSVHVPIQFIT